MEHDSTGSCISACFGSGTLGACKNQGTSYAPEMVGSMHIYIYIYTCMDMPGGGFLSERRGLALVLDTRFRLSAAQELLTPRNRPRQRLEARGQQQHKHLRILQWYMHTCVYMYIYICYGSTWYRVLCI